MHHRTLGCPSHLHHRDGALEVFGPGRQPPSFAGADTSPIARARSSKPDLRRSCHATSCHGSQAYGAVVRTGPSPATTATRIASASSIEVGDSGCSTYSFRL